MVDAAHDSNELDADKDDDAETVAPVVEGAAKTAAEEERADGTAAEAMAEAPASGGGSVSSFADLRWAWKLVCNVVLLVGVMLSLVVLMEIARAYVLLRDVSPLFGYAFLAVLSLVALAILWRLFIMAFRRPRVLTPPAFADQEQPTKREILKYAAYLIRYLRRLGDNPQLSVAEQGKARTEADRLTEFLRRPTVPGGPSGVEVLCHRVEEAEKDVIKPLLAVLDEKADKEIQKSVTNIMIGVALSPWNSADLLIVIYRSTKMVVSISRIYNARPQLRELLSTLRDVAGIVAIVNFANLGGALLKGLSSLSTVPLLGRAVDAATQSIGAGIMTSVAGHAAKGRCSAYRRWEEAEFKKSILPRLGIFCGDVKAIFRTQVAGGLGITEKYTESFKKAVNAAFESVLSTPPAMLFHMNRVVQPAVAVASGGVAVSHRGVKAVGMAVAGGGRAVGRTVAGGGCAVGRTAAGAGRLAGRGAGATWRGTWFVGTKIGAAGSGIGRGVKWVFTRKKAAGAQAEDADTDGSDKDDGADSSGDT